MNIVELIREKKQAYEDKKVVNAIQSLDRLKVRADYAQKIRAIEDQKKEYRDEIAGAKKAERANNPIFQALDKAKAYKAKREKKASIKFKGPEGGGIFG